MAGASVQKKNDPVLRRDVLEVRHEEGFYRLPAVLGERFLLTGLLSMGGFGVIFTAEDRWLYDKKVLVKANRYPKKLFRVPNNKAVVKEIENMRSRLDQERKMLLEAMRRGVSGTPVLLEEIFDMGLDLYGPHQDEQGRSHVCEQRDEAGRELWRHEPYLVLGFVDGTPLKSALLEYNFRKNLLGNAKQVILQIGRILKSFHKERAFKGHGLRFVYQDLKPDNIIFTREKLLVLIDFGSFAVNVDGATMPQFARTGTPGYQPPEFVDPNFPSSRIDSRADVFSLGATVFHVLTGEPPPANARGEAVIAYEKLGRIPTPWRDWVKRATEPDRDRRFDNMHEAIEASHPLPLK